MENLDLDKRLVALRTTEQGERLERVLRAMIDAGVEARDIEIVDDVIESFLSNHAIAEVRVKVRL